MCWDHLRDNKYSHIQNINSNTWSPEQSAVWSDWNSTGISNDTMWGRVTRLQEIQSHLAHMIQKSYHTYVHIQVQFPLMMNVIVRSTAVPASGISSSTQCCRLNIFTKPLLYFKKNNKKKHTHINSQSNLLNNSALYLSDKRKQLGGVCRTYRWFRVLKETIENEACITGNITAPTSHWKLPACQTQVA